tara:strand:- start:515 stop:811 length:297 start_codon:yes stop_codon:yes gene_type:complete
LPSKSAHCHLERAVLAHAFSEDASCWLVVEFELLPLLDDADVLDEDDELDAEFEDPEAAAGDAPEEPPPPPPPQLTSEEIIKAIKNIFDICDPKFTAE